MDHACKELNLAFAWGQIKHISYHHGWEESNEGREEMMRKVKQLSSSMAKCTVKETKRPRHKDNVFF